MSRPGLSINSSDDYELTEFSRTPIEPTPAVARPAQDRPLPVQRAPGPSSHYTQQPTPHPGLSSPAPQYPQLPQPSPPATDAPQVSATEARPIEEMFIQCSVCRVTLRYARGVPLVMCPCCRSYTASEQMFFLRCFRCGAGYYSQPGARPFYCSCGIVVYPPSMQPPPMSAAQPQSTTQPPTQLASESQPQTQTATSIQPPAQPQAHPPTELTARPHSPSRLSTERLTSVEVLPSSLS